MKASDQIDKFELLVNNHFISDFLNYKQKWKIKQSNTH